VAVNVGDIEADTYADVDAHGAVGNEDRGDDAILVPAAFIAADATTV
jgi:hypothetical protein